MELAHYGILGMHWGRRKARYTDAASVGVRLEKDSTINRIADSGDERIGGMKYAAFKKEDVEMYEFMLGSGKFNFQYKLKETLVSPSEKRQVDAFIETVKDISVKEAAATLKTMSKFSTLKGIEKELTNAVSGKDKSIVKTYDKFIDLMYSEKLEPIRKHYFNKLSKEGYNMIIDSSDKDVVSDMPIIIFSGSKSLSFVKKKRIEEEGMAPRTTKRQENLTKGGDKR
jgi:hypothetical protein